MRALSAFICVIRGCCFCFSVPHDKRNSRFEPRRSRGPRGTIDHRLAFDGTGGGRPLALALTEVVHNVIIRLAAIGVLMGYG